MFWGPSDGLRQVLSTRHAALVLKYWSDTVMAPRHVVQVTSIAAGCHRGAPAATACHWDATGGRG